MAEEKRPVLVMGEEFPTCPVCGRRLEVDYSMPVDADADGPMYRATCPEHGDWRVQDGGDEDQDEESEDD